MVCAACGVKPVTSAFVLRGWLWSGWGGATNAEVKRLMLDHAFTFVDCVTFQVGETNHRSRGAMCKIGGVLRDETIDVALNGVTIRHVVFEVCKPE